MSGTAHLHSDINSYLSGMDRASLQKAVFAALARPGKIIDKGCGSGITAHDLALLFPGSHITGIDLDPRMVEHAAKTYRRPNLSFQVGDAEKRSSPDASVDAIFFSSILHHLTSYGTGHFDTTHVEEAVSNSVRELKDHGLLILRDFLVPDGPEWCLLDVLDSDVSLFLQFTKDFRSSQHPNSGVEFEKVSGAPPQFQRFRLRLRDATEFILRKDYHESYAAEIKEEYCFFRQSDYERTLRKNGLRLLSSTPIRNPWIIKNRFVGQCALWTEGKDRLPFPATNFAIVGQKISAGEGVEIVESRSDRVTKPTFIYLSALRDRKNNYIYDLVGRPHATIDLLPYFLSDDRLFVLAKQSFPRPILNIQSAVPNLSGARTGGYVVESLSFIHRDEEPLHTAVETELYKRARITASEILPGGNHDPLSFYPSPGMTDERVSCVFVALQHSNFSSLPAENYSGFQSSGHVRAFEADQALRSAQAGGVFESRLEIAIYFQLLRLKRPVGPWVGDAITADAQPGKFSAKSVMEVLEGQKQRGFDKADNAEAGKYLEIRRGTFEERSSDGKVIASQQREYVQPIAFSHNVGSVAPYFKTEKGEFIIGLERRELPSVQVHEGSSTISTCPAWRLPRTVSSLEQMKEWITERLLQDFQCTTRELYFLGGHYYTSAGVTPECIYPMAIEVDSAKGLGKLHWVRLVDLIEQRTHIHDGRLLTHSLRLAHALGALK